VLGKITERVAFNRRKYLSEENNVNNKHLIMYMSYHFLYYFISEILKFKE